MLCQGFNTTQFDAFFANYNPIMLKYAKLAQDSGVVDEYFVSHELMTCVKDAPVTTHAICRCCVIPRAN